MSDLVERLRAVCCPDCVDGDACGDCQAIHNAANEIERLRRACATGWGEPMLVEILKRERDEVRARLDRADCTHREGGDTRHCRHDRLCWHCRHDEAVALLRELEWVYSQAGPPFCQECRRDKAHGHTPDCRLDAFLAGGGR